MLVYWSSPELCDTRRSAWTPQPNFSLDGTCLKMRIASGPNYWYADYWAFTFTGPPAGALAVSGDDAQMSSQMCSRARWFFSGSTSECARVSIQPVE